MIVVVLPGCVSTITITCTELELEDDEEEELEEEEDEESAPFPLSDEPAFEEPDEDEPALEEESLDEDEDEETDPDPELEILAPGTFVAAGEVSDWPAGGGARVLALAGAAGMLSLAGGDGGLLGGDAFAGGAGFDIALIVGAGPSPAAFGAPAVMVAVHWLIVSVTVTVWTLPA